MRAAVLGRPVSHSLSPLLHRAAYAALGLTDWTYDALDIGAEDLPVLLAGLGEEWRGFSVTMPCKQAAVDVADVVEPLPRPAAWRCDWPAPKRWPPPRSSERVERRRRPRWRWRPWVRGPSTSRSG